MSKAVLPGAEEGGLHGEEHGEEAGEAAAMGGAKPAIGADGEGEEVDGEEDGVDGMEGEEEEVEEEGAEEEERGEEAGDFVGGELPPDGMAAGEDPRRMKPEELHAASKGATLADGFAGRILGGSIVDFGGGLEGAAVAGGNGAHGEEDIIKGGVGREGLGEFAAHGVKGAGGAGYGGETAFAITNPFFVAPVGVDAGGGGGVGVGGFEDEFAGDDTDGGIGEVGEEVGKGLRIEALADVHHDEEVAGGEGDEVVEDGGFATAFGKGDEADTGIVEVVEGGLGVVVAGVVADEDFVDAVGLGVVEEGPDFGGEAGGFVVDGDDDGDGEGVVGFGDRTRAEAGEEADEEGVAGVDVADAEKAKPEEYGG